MYRENGKPVFPSIKAMIRQAERIGRHIADEGGDPVITRLLAPAFGECADALGYNAAMAIVETARETRAAELEAANR